MIFILNILCHVQLSSGQTQNTSIQNTYRHGKPLWTKTAVVQCKDFSQAESMLLKHICTLTFPTSGRSLGGVTENRGLGSL